MMGCLKKHFFPKYCFESLRFRHTVGLTRLNTRATHDRHDAAFGLPAFPQQGSTLLTGVGT